MHDVAANVQRLHEERLAFFERRKDVELPAAKQEVDQLRAVLGGGAGLTDKLANAVFKDVQLLRNAKAKEKEAKKAAQQKQSAAPSATKEAPLSAEAVETLQERAKEHRNWLRRFKGKTGDRLTLDERLAIEGHIAKRQRWIDEVESDAEYMEYVFAAQPIIDRIQAEERRLQTYLEDEAAELEERASRERAKRPKLSQPTPTTETLPPPEPPDASALVPASSLSSPTNKVANNKVSNEVSNDVSNKVSTEVSNEVSNKVSNDEVSNNNKDGKNVRSAVIYSDAFTDLRHMQSEYFQLIGKDDPTGLQAEALLVKDYGRCKECNVDMIVNIVEAIQSCPQCAKVAPWQDRSLRVVPFGDPVSAPRSKGKYDKRTYYEFWKKMVTGELHREIPDEDWQAIYEECVSRRLNEVTRPLVRKILRQLRMTHHYKYCHMITNELNDVPLIRWDPEEERTLDALFEESRVLFEMCPKEITRNRSSFMSYGYFFYQACNMAGYEEYLPSFSLLEGTDNLKQHDKIWKWMCDNKEEKLGPPAWTFFPTV